MDDIKRRIDNKELTIGIIGLGYVGLPLAVEFARNDFNVIGIELDKNKVDKINNGVNYIKDVDDDLLKELVKKGKIKATTDYSVLNEIDAVSICVPTPLNKTKEPDISFIVNVRDEIVKYLHKGMLIVLESTTYPGTTDEVLLPVFESTGMKVGKDFYLAFSPERVDPGNPIYQTNNTPKVFGGVTKQCTEIGSYLYGKIIEKIVPVSSTRAAEAVKILENTYRSINIGLANEIAIMCDKLNINVWEVIDAASTKPFGFQAFYPGPGLGGHCIPIDPLYLSWKMKFYNYNAKFITLADEINSNMPKYIVSRIGDILNEKSKSIKDSKILILGVTYKKDIDDLRESPVIDIVSELLYKKANVFYNDPYIKEFYVVKDLSEISKDSVLLHSTELTSELLEEMDLIVITTNHSSYNYKFIIEHSDIIFDTRNATKEYNDEKIVYL
ncbi:nucleotide sugar dehydrogenase [candidate division WOR-3 bacterium]|nr:nucleotide sugar dehydrogenase [candidate division WOR-3 bacterium]